MTIRNNRAIGGEGNTQGDFAGTGIGGGIANYASNPFAAPGGSTVTLTDCTMANNQAVGGADAGGWKRGRELLRGRRARLGQYADPECGPRG